MPGRGTAHAARVLVLNAGSSSLKFKLFSADSLKAGLSGLVERIGDVLNSKFTAKDATVQGGSESPRRWDTRVPISDHTEALDNVLQFLTKHVSRNFAKEVLAVGHRVVHGADMSKPVLLTPDKIAKIKGASALAPLHNPAGLQGIAAAQRIFQDTPQVAVFDTAFHQTMPSYAFMYGLPFDLYQKNRIRKYGFHGTSHMYLMQEAAKFLKRPSKDLNMITCHLGNGCSMTAIRRGESVDTSMGLTPLEGLMMGTRSGDMDPAVPLYLMSSLSLAAKDVDTLLNKRSGLLGICGQNDIRSVLQRQDSGDEQAALALDMFVYRIRKYLGAYIVALTGHVDAIIFSGGIGENSAKIRQLICEGLQGLGIVLDSKANDGAGGPETKTISTDSAAIKLLVIPTDEEASIAAQTVAVVKAS